MLKTNARRIGVFIDVQNMYYSARNIFNQKVQFAKIVEETAKDGQLLRALAYTITTEDGQEEAFLNALASDGIEVVSKELLEYSSGNKKGDWDVGITIDIIRILDMVDEVVLVSGDGDFVPLIDYIRSRGRIAHVASFRESTSTLLVEAADIYTNLSDDTKTFLVPTRKRTARKKSTASKSKTTKKTPKKESQKQEETDYMKQKEEALRRSRDV